MAMAPGIGAELADGPADVAEHGWWFGEDQGRYVLAVDAATAAGAERRAAGAGVPVRRLGLTGGAALTLPDGTSISVGDLRDVHEAWLPDLMSGPAG